MADKRPHAILVAHGIGQQRPYQVLDSFARGLWKAVGARNITHCRDGSGVFDHFIRVDRPLNADVYEFYWASMLVGQATFAGIVRWILNTAFTPLRRFSYAVPLILLQASADRKKAMLERAALGHVPAGEKKRAGFVALTIELVAMLAVPFAVAVLAFGAARTALLYLGVTLRLKMGIENWISLLVAIGLLVVTALLRRRYPDFPWWKVTAQLVRELWRIAYVTVVAVAAAVGGAFVVNNAARFGKSLLAYLGKLAIPRDWTPADWITVFGFTCASLAFVALLISLRRQFQDYRLLNRRLAFARSRKSSEDVAEDDGQLMLERRGRRWVLALTFFALVFLGLFIWRAGRDNTACQVLVFCISPVVHNLLIRIDANQSALWSAAGTAALLALGAFIKTAYVDYIGDVALYTTADENSEFFKTREAILKESTRKIRWLLRRYERVSLVGHSLGSVIMFDSIGRLRLEYQVHASQGSASAERIQGQIHARIDGEFWGRIHGEVDVPPASHAKDDDQPITAAEFKQITHLVTFGSPLDKVTYFFRTTVGSDESIRAHILQEIHGMRRPAVLTTNDDGILDVPAFRPGTHFRWLNVYSPLDPVSARLVFYEDVRNEWRWYWIWGLCHMQYWHDRKFYEDLVVPFLTKAEPQPPDTPDEAFKAHA